MSDPVPVDPILHRVAARPDPTSSRPDPRGRSLPVTKLWLDGRLTPVDGAVMAVDAGGSVWRVTARLPQHDPFTRPYGLSVQLADGRALHGTVRLIGARDGEVTFEGHDAPEGGWV